MKRAPILLKTVGVSEPRRPYLENILDASVNQLNVHDVQQRVGGEDLAPEGKAVPAVSPGRGRDPHSTPSGSVTPSMALRRLGWNSMEEQAVCKALDFIPSVNKATSHLALALPGHRQTRWSFKVWDTDPREELVPTELTHAHVVTPDVPASRTVSPAFCYLQGPALWYCDIKT